MYLDELVGVLLEDARVLLDAILVTALGGVDQYQQRHVRLQEAVAHVIHHRLAQLTSQVFRSLAHLVDSLVQAL